MARPNKYSSLMPTPGGGGAAGFTPQQNAGNPNGVVAPNLIGDICIDTDNDIAYINVDNTNTGWKAAAA